MRSAPAERLFATIASAGLPMTSTPSDSGKSARRSARYASKAEAAVASSFVNGSTKDIPVSGNGSNVMCGGAA
jgi:hypothetical protein